MRVSAVMYLALCFADSDACHHYVKMNMAV